MDWSDTREKQVQERSIVNHSQAIPSKDLEKAKTLSWPNKSYFRVSLCTWLLSWPQSGLGSQNQTEAMWEAGAGGHMWISLSRPAIIQLHFWEISVSHRSPWAKPEMQAVTTHMLWRNGLAYILSLSLRGLKVSAWQPHAFVYVSESCSESWIR